MSSKYPELETQRLTLREPGLADAEKFHELLCMSEISTLSNIPQDPTRKRSERFVSWMSKLFTRGKGCAWIITPQDTGEVIGAIRINEIHKKASYGEIGYELNPEYWNQGLMSEAVAAVTTCGHNDFNLNRMEAWVIPGNAASENVLTKNGYNYEGTLRQRVNLRGNLCDIKMYGHLAIN